VLHDRRWLLVALTLIGACSGCDASPQTSTQAPDAASLEAQVDALFAARIRPDGPGCAVGVYKDGAVLLTRAYGLANVEDGRRITPRTTFSLGSLSKPFTALAVLVLEQQGKLSLEDDVRRWLPELPDYGTPIRLRDLLHHTSGVRDFQALEMLSGRHVTTMDEFLDLITAQRALHFVPGSRHEYSHSDYLLLGLVIERLGRLPFGEHLERQVLEPMGMRSSVVNDARGRALPDRAFGHLISSTGPRVQFPASQTFGGDNLYSSVEDLARWDRQFEEPAVGGVAVMARMLERPLLASGEVIPYAYGLRHEEYRGLPIVKRGGNDDGSRTEVIRFPDQHFTVATLCNADTLPPGTLGEGVADLYLGASMRPAPPRPEAPAPVATPAGEISGFVGLYRPPEESWDVLPIDMRDGVLGEVLFDDQHDEWFFPMTPIGDGRFVERGLTGNIGILTFHRPARGAPLRLEMSWNGGPADSAERIPDAAVWRPSAATLAEYAGSWFSSDLDSAWRIEARGDRLVLGRLGRRDLTLRPVTRDEFVRGFGPWESATSARLQFHRDTAGRLTHLTVSTHPGEESARDVRFVRVPGG